MTHTVGLVSIIIPAYKAKAFLAETLQRVSEQEYDQWEVIVVEDGTEEVAEIVNEFAGRHAHNRVEYIRNIENRGVSETRNIGVRVARGEFISFLDADDLWFPRHLRDSVSSLNSGDCDLVFSGSTMFDSATGLPIGVWGPSPAEAADIARSLLWRSYLLPSTVVMRHTSVIATGTFDSSFKTCEDLDFWLRALKGGVRFKCLPGTYCLYRKGHPGAATSNIAALGLDYTRVLEKHSKDSFFTPELANALRRHYLYTSYWNAVKSPRLAMRMFWKGVTAKPWQIDRRSIIAACSCAIGLFVFVGRVMRSRIGRVM